ncbi:hypothetical protein F5Y10DRAFT_236486 [Nemania abortiva]|nr:hypothetical protein F5Y10DRAFT_236486 [Nemania abortiva]
MALGVVLLGLMDGDTSLPLTKSPIRGRAQAGGGLLRPRCGTQTRSVRDSDKAIHTAYSMDSGGIASLVAMARADWMTGRLGGGFV